MNWDFFISHATEDKAEVARPVAEILTAKGFKVWYDEYTLTMGDNLRRSIENGLANSRYGIVVLSPSFFAKKWTNLELDGLFALERAGEKRILPVWHQVNASDVEQFSSMMAMRLGVSTSNGVDHVVQKIVEAVTQGKAQLANEEYAPGLVQLHPHSIEILAAAQTGDGTVLVFQHMGGTSVLAGGKPMGEENSPRAEALNLHCLDELLNNDLLEQKSDSLLVLTQEGFDFQPPHGIIDAPQPTFPNISDANYSYAKDLLRAGVAGDGRILSLSHYGGHVLQAGEWARDSGGDPRLQARWQSVLKELVRAGLLLRRSENMYLVSHVGFLWTDKINAQHPSASG